MIGTRWVDIDKGDEAKPDYRSRLVAKEFNNGQEDGALCFYPTVRGTEVDYQPHCHYWAGEQDW